MVELESLSPPVRLEVFIRDPFYTTSSLVPSESDKDDMSL